MLAQNDINIGNQGLDTRNLNKLERLYPSLKKA